MFSRSRVACFLWCRRQNGDRRTTVYQVTGREESYRLFGRDRYDAITDSLLRFPTPFVDPVEGSNVPRAGQGSAATQRVVTEFVVVPTNLPLILLLASAAFSSIFLENGVDSGVDCGHKLGRCNSISPPGGGDTLDILPPPNAQVVLIPNYFSLTTKINKMVQLKQYLLSISSRNDLQLSQKSSRAINHKISFSPLAIITTTVHAKSFTNLNILIH